MGTNATEDVFGPEKLSGLMYTCMHKLWIFLHETVQTKTRQYIRVMTYVTRISILSRHLDHVLLIIYAYCENLSKSFAGLKSLKLYVLTFCCHETVVICFHAEFIKFCHQSLNVLRIPVQRSKLVWLIFSKDFQIFVPYYEIELISSYHPLSVAKHYIILKSFTKETPRYNIIAYIYVTGNKCNQGFHVIPKLLG